MKAWIVLLTVAIGYFSLANGMALQNPNDPCYPNPCAPPQQCIAVAGACMNPPCPLMATCQDADTSCPPNEKMNSCGNHCEPNCETRNNGFFACMAMCGSPACMCVDGYFRQDGVCVPETQCREQSCPPNERLNTCGNHCEPTCETKGFAPCMMMCAPPACECEMGYYRQDGVCVPEDQCREQSCPRNERLNTCGNDCESTCENRNNGLAPSCICGQPACECEMGYYRQDGVCVPEHECKGEKPGLCPMIKMVATACRDDCLKDEDCSGEMKCCGQCVKQCLKPLILVDTPPLG